MSSWLSQGTASRTRVQRTPVIHLLVQQAGEWRLWCSGGKGREDNPHGNRLCGMCRDLAREAFEHGDVDAHEVRRWLTPEQLAKAVPSSST